MCFFVLDNEEKKKVSVIKENQMALTNKDFQHKTLEIKTKSIEATLIPLVTQISTLVNFKEKPRLPTTTNEKPVQDINRIGDVVYMAVERFVSVGRYLFFLVQKQERKDYNILHAW